MKAPSGRKTRNLQAPEALLTIHTAQEYDAAVARLNALVDEIGDNPKDPRYRLIETLSLLIEAYDREHHGLPEGSVIDVIRFLMEQHGLSQKDLPRDREPGGCVGSTRSPAEAQRAPDQSPRRAFRR